MKHYYMRFNTEFGYTTACYYLFPHSKIYWKSGGKHPSGKGYELSIVLY